MEFREMIEQGIEITGSQRALAATLGTSETSMPSVKSGRRSLPDDACMRLAQLIEAPLGAVIAARNYALAKDEEHRQFWLPFVTNDWRRGRDSNPCARFP